MLPLDGAAAVALAGSRCGRGRDPLVDPRFPGRLADCSSSSAACWVPNEGADSPGPGDGFAFGSGVGVGGFGVSVVAGVGALFPPMIVSPYPVMTADADPVPALDPGLTRGPRGRPPPAGPRGRFCGANWSALASCWRVMASTRSASGPARSSAAREAPCRSAAVNLAASCRVAMSSLIGACCGGGCVGTCWPPPLPMWITPPTDLARLSTSRRAPRLSLIGCDDCAVCARQGWPWMASPTASDSPPATCGACWTPSTTP
jgi:hypothetical protein